MKTIDKIITKVDIFKKEDVVKYDNGKHQETFVVESVGEHHLYSTKYNIPSFKKSYCTKVS